MHYLILAAGKSSRIYSKIKKNKCLLNIKKETLIKKAINNILYFSKPEDKIHIVTGFKQNLIKKELSSKKLNFIHNKKYNSTEMLYSMMFALNKIKKDNTIVIYSDIIFSKVVLNKLISLNSSNIIIPVLKNWKKVWNIKNKKIYDDAETLKINIQKNKVLEIGKKIKISKDIPKYQYMGIIYFPKNYIKKILKIFKSNKDFKHMHLTNFIDYLINKKFDVSPIITTSHWYEFDDYEDYLNYKKNENL